MKKLLVRFLNDDDGALIATEWLFVVTILVIGLVAGLTSVRNAVVNELEDVADAVGSLSQSYSFGGTRGCCARTNSSQFTDSVKSYPVDVCTDPILGPAVTCPD